MGFFLLLLLLLALVLAIPLGWAMIKACKLRFADARAEIVSPENVEGDVLVRLEKMVAPLVESGFTYLGMRSEQREGGSYTQAVLSSAGGIVWAVVEEPEHQGLGREVSFVSFSEEGTVIVTADGDPKFGPEERHGIFQEGPFSSALAQAEAHAATIEADEVALQQVSGENFIKWLDRRSRRKLDYMFESEWLQETSNEQLKVSLPKLPIAGLAILQQAWKLRKREKGGQSWLLNTHLLATEEPAEPELAVAESSPEPMVAVAEEEFVVPERVVAPIAPLPVAPQADLVPDTAAEAFRETIAEEMAPPLPAEDGLERDFAIYQQQASQKSWAYWLRGFGGRAFFFLSVVAFVAWLAFSRGWSPRLLLYGVVALLVHELGHVIVMALRRSWDWSQLLFPLPRPMAARSWPIGGGAGELMTTLAGPLPGLIFGWGFLAAAFLGQSVSEPILDFALVCALVNSFTLLPILPLDGGRLLDMALLRNAPGLRTFGLVVAGLVALIIALLGGGVLLGILAILLWSGVPAARRKSLLLPWMRANVKNESLQSSEAALAILRENRKERLFKGAGGAAKLDELTGLSRVKALGALGSIGALAVILFTWLGPMAFPVAEVAQRLQSQKEEQEQAALLANQYWPAPPSTEIDTAQRKALGSLKAALAAETPENVFADSSKLELVRFSIDGKAFGPWADESLKERFPTVIESVRALRREAMSSADKGDSLAAFRDISYAFRILSAWEPSHELGAWVSWMELERDILEELEDISSRYPLPDSKVKWFEDALTRFRQPSGPKIAALLLREGSEAPSLLDEDPKEFMRRLATKGKTKQELPAGRTFLANLRRPAEILSPDSSPEKIKQARAIVTASAAARNWDSLGQMVNASDSLKKSLSRIEANRSFREIALSGLRVKRLGAEGAQPELAKLRSEFGYQSRVVKEGERESLKLSRLTAGGERVEMEWMLKQ